MKILKAIYERLIRLIISVALQIPWALAGVGIHFYVHQVFPEKIQKTFGVMEAQNRLDLATQAAAVMKSMISVSNPMASVNYLTSLVEKTMAWSRLNSSQIFANAVTTLSLWFIDICLFLGGIYLIWRALKTYRHKSRQKENVQLVSKELAPYFNQLKNEIQGLREEIQTLKNEKSRFTNSFDSRG